MKMKEYATELEDRLAEAESVIENCKNDKNNEDPKLDIQEDEVNGLSTQVDVVTGLLKSANSALLAVTHEGFVMVPDCSLETETDLSSWQLDLMVFSWWSTTHS